MALSLKILDIQFSLQGMKRFDARTAVLDALKEKGLYRRTKEHQMVVPVCSRSKDIVEPLIKPQWYMDTREMDREAMEVRSEGRGVGERFSFKCVFNVC